MQKLRWREADLKRVLDYLRENVGIFQEVKRKFCIGDDLGLASLPEWYICSNYAFVGQVIFENGQYYPHFFLSAEEPGPVMPPIPQDRIIVRPVCDHYGVAYLVSIYFSKIAAEERHLVLEGSFLQAPEAVLKGIFAHECAEYLLRFNERLILPEMQRTLGDKLKYLPEFVYFAYPPDVRDDLIEQCRADLLASLVGYKEELLSLFRFIKDTLPKDGDPAKDFQARIDFIEKTA